MALDDPEHVWEKLVRIPTFLKECISVCNLKPMRLVSQGTRTAVSAHVEGCTLVITGDLEEHFHIFPFLALLQHSTLSRLVIYLDGERVLNSSEGILTPRKPTT